ncbi:uncharacterized protein EI97DRAFT_89690 [Westerdykella ornata]|uniref:Uncharacterized protein n=1 Tax=Westerdykella ornata TaxID=318751 RepID=A0A6A6JES5_WESOR|nr:uncharacterized protein EI97DRAFT_89690 [Westerdykella ornata]KAF2274807.1 hypothetical protein EI97DRAFT_89690 [Westerdykella ornata]
MSSIMSPLPLATTPEEAKKAIIEESTGLRLAYSEIRHYLLKEPRCPVCEQTFLDLREKFVHSVVTKEIFWARAYLRAIDKIHPDMLDIKPLPQEDLLLRGKKCPLCTLTVVWREREGDAGWVLKRYRAKNTWEKVQAMKELHIQIDPKKQKAEEKRVKELLKDNSV